MRSRSCAAVLQLATVTEDTRASHAHRTSPTSLLAKADFQSVHASR